LAALSLAAAASASIAQEAPAVYRSTLALPTYYAWMNTSVKAAWAKGYEGKGVTITFVDEFNGTDPFAGSWTGTTVTQLHGLFTTEEAGLLAPQATIIDKDFNTYTSAVSLKSGLNVINASYAIYAPAYYKQYGSSIWNGDAQEQSIIADAKNGKAVVVKAAGNDAVAIGSTLGSGSQGGAGNVDFLDTALEGAATAIYAGALNNNGSAGGKQTMAWYSDTAGSNKTVQQHFLVVGVDGALTNLYGTSFAAPTISAYAAILGSKFTKATATQITNQLLDTALTSTLQNYSASVYGRGEANLTGALAPTSIH
jgi:hypothetical protein